MVKLAVGAAIAAGALSIGVTVVAAMHYHGRNNEPAGVSGGLGGDEPSGGGSTQTGAGGDPVAGKRIFAANCAACHGPEGHGGAGGPDISGQRETAHVVEQVTNGGGGMPPFKGALTEKQIRDVAAWVAHPEGK
jgi:mono/diheme cytochrome c family protein